MHLHCKFWTLNFFATSAMPIINKEYSWDGKKIRLNLSFFTDWKWLQLKNSMIHIEIDAGYNHYGSRAETWWIKNRLAVQKNYINVYYSMQLGNDHKVNFFASMIQIIAHQMWSTCNFSVPENFASSTRRIVYNIKFNDLIHQVPYSAGHFIRIE